MIRFWLHYFVLYALMATVWPYFPTFLRSLGFSNAQVGYLQGVRMLAGAAGPLLLGWLSNRLRKRRLLLSACVVAFVMVAVPLSRTGVFWLAVPLVAVAGLCLRTTIPLSDTLAASELDDPENQYGKARMGGTVGFILTLLAIRLLSLIDESSPASMVTGMLIAAAAAFLIVWLLPEHRSFADSGRTADDDASFGLGFWIFIVAAGLQQLGMSSYYSLFTNYLKDVLAMEQAAWVWALASLAEMPFLFFAGILTRRFRLSTLLMLSMLGVTVRLTVYAAVPATGPVLAAQGFHALTFGVFHISCIEFIRRRTLHHRRALAMGWYVSLAVALPLWLGSSVGGEVVERFGYRALYGAYAAVPLLGVALLAATRRHIDTVPDKTAALIDAEERK